MFTRLLASAVLLKAAGPTPLFLPAWKCLILDALTEAGAGTPHPLQGCGWFDFPVMHDACGNLTVIEGARHVPFPIERLCLLYDIPSQSERAGHAHRVLTQVFIGPD